MHQRCNFSEDVTNTLARYRANNVSTHTHTHTNKQDKTIMPSATLPWAEA